jgi:uncharacterized protein YcbX
MPMKVLQLWRYPVKSMAGERLDESAVDDLGLPGDRWWGVVDLETGKVLTAKREARLLHARARLVGDDEVEVELPDGRLLTSDDQLSAWLGRRVSLQRAGESGGHFENPRDFENETDWVDWQGPPRAWHDMRRARVSVVSTGSLGQWDVRRFRPNVLVDGDGEGALVGRSVRLGTAILSVTTLIERCVVITREQPGITKDLDVLRQVNREHDGLVAVGALVETPGFVKVGGELLVVEQSPTGDRQAAAAGA